MFFLQGAKGFYDLLLISALFFCFFIRRSKTADLVQNLVYIILGSDVAGVLDNPTILGSGPSGRSGRTDLISGLENTGQETSVYQRRESETDISATLVEQEHQLGPRGEFRKSHSSGKSQSELPGCSKSKKTTLKPNNYVCVPIFVWSSSVKYFLTGPSQEFASSCGFFLPFPC